MRGSHAKLSIWPFGDGPGPEAHTDQELRTDMGATPEAFDSFGPISDIRKALTPRAQQQQTRMRGPHEELTRILLAEHDAFQRRMLRVLLSSERVTVIEVEDGQSAVDLLALRSFDLLLLDMDLPLMTGPDTITWVRRSLTPWADIPILGLIDEKHRPMVGKLMSIGMTDYTLKPFNRFDVVDKLVKLMPGLYDAGL
ncbi:MAG TPA: response regulator [Hyphomonadaceae bacterium]|nr:response regulator [Hyphomonadaceae bacterium]